jgi:hypothetical protein
MPPDLFEKLAATALVEGAKVLVPGGGLIIAAGRALLGDPNETLRTEVFSQLQDHVARLQAAVDELDARLQQQGRKVDELDAIARGRITEQFLQSMIKSTSPRRREVLTWATARLFDPSVGPFGQRTFWLETIERLSGAELETLQQMSEGALYLDRTDIVVGPTEAFLKQRNVMYAESNGARRIPVGAGNVAATTAILTRLMTQTNLPLIEGTSGAQDDFQRGYRQLTAAGAQLVALLQPPVPLGAP